jgi:hypothetical protein
MVMHADNFFYTGLPEAVPAEAVSGQLSHLVLPKRK